MKSIILWIGVFILGISPVDLYIAWDMPNALLSIYAVVLSWPINSTEEVVLSFGAVMYPVLFTMAISYSFVKAKKRFFILFIPATAIINCSTFIYICASSGYDNLSSILISLVSITFIIAWAVLSYKDTGANKTMHPTSG